MLTAKHNASGKHCQASSCFVLVAKVSSSLRWSRNKKNPHAVYLGRLGGKARKQKLTGEQRRQIAKAAAEARWARQKGKASEAGATKKVVLTNVLSDCPLPTRRRRGFCRFQQSGSFVDETEWRESNIRHTHFNLAYTYGNSTITHPKYATAYKPGQFRASSDFDVTQGLTFSGGWDLSGRRDWHHRYSQLHGI